MTYSKKTGPIVGLSQVRENGKTKELFIELPRSTLSQVGWDVGDDLIWEELKVEYGRNKRLTNSIIVLL